MTDDLVLSNPVAPAVAVSREIDGLEMGVLTNGTAYLNGRSLARLCGVAPSTIINQGDRWLAGERNNKLAQMLVAEGLERPSLFETVTVAGKKVHAYSDEVCMVFLEYYAFETPAPTDQARQNFRKLAKAGLRLFVYRALGYDPANQIPEAWREFHDRLMLAKVPFGFFSVFREMTEFMLMTMQKGLPCDHKTISDISVGKIWSKYWEANRLDDVYGFRKRAEHNYPDYFPQAASNPQDIWVYPVAAVGAFRIWLATSYIPTSFPNYLRSKVREGVLPPSTVELLLAEVVTPVLESGSPPVL